MLILNHIYFITINQYILNKTIILLLKNMELLLKKYNSKCFYIFKIF